MTKFSIDFDDGTSCNYSGKFEVVAAFAEWVADDENTDILTIVKLED